MTENDIIVEVRDHRHDRNMVSISAHDKEYESKSNVDGYVLIPFEGYKSVGLVQCLTMGSRKVNNPYRSRKCKALLEYISSGATIRIDGNLKE
ncbi:hypothetical protein FR932_00055 (plasmid) [Moritella marina ATCC 15381]|uniref:Uncharacterized protein n=1 Tax=Moritella marina ATCC 15381 TaxID=1202962 RepID=A0A5J6WGI1_MORMI|nr:hypothetical protein [Moritella marina]QFI36318.1 hypothetical protein FR932_00055 [Moritella marina ATCC 15381]